MTIQEKAIEQLERISEHLSAIGEKEDYTDIAIKALEAQPCIEDYPTCTECEHYDSEKHYCPRFCQVIRDTLAEAQPSKDCRNCKKWNKCPCGKEGHENGTSIGYSIGECKDYEPSEDCISRKDTIEWLKKVTVTEGIEFKTGFKQILYDIEQMPPVKPQRPKGKWINKFGKEQGYDIAGIKTWYIQILCDKCGFIKTAIEGHTGQYHYCPNCGAEMSGGGEDEVSD